ncbi:MAG: hypothetical protein GY930_00465 [bacterium]|nr:hypothetical protein [bacterium]
MTDNPYQTPSSQVDRPTGRGPGGGTGSFTIGQSLSEAWEATIGNLGVVIGAAIVSTIIMFVSAITIIGYFVVIPVMMWGMTRFALNLMDGRADFNDIFSGFTNYGSRLGRTLLLGIVMVILGMVGNIPYYVGMFMDSDILMGVGWLINMAFSLFIMSRLYFAILYMVDRDLGAMESIQASLEGTRAMWGWVILLAIVSSIIGMLGILALLVGLLVSIPVAYLMWVSAYRQMEGGPPE